MRTTILSLLVLLCVSLTGCRARDTAKPTDGAEVDTALFDARPFDYHATTLANGMQVITLEDHSTPIAAVQVWYHVGSKDERPNRRGFAHMFEHMMFRGTQNIGPKAHFEYIRRVGGDANAYTSFDNTTYIQVVPSNQVEMVLWLEAERMGFLKINDGYFDTERKVVAEEYRMGRERPYGTVPDRLLAKVFSKHPYRWTPIGNMEELAEAEARELQEFWNTYYVPNNAALVVVGDVDHAEVEKLAESYFGWIPRYPDPPRVEVEEPAQTERLKITLEERNGPVPIVGIAYRTVPMGHADEVPLQLLGTILGAGESSRLYRDLVTERDLAMFALSGGFALEDEGVFAAGAVLSPLGGKPDTTVAAIREHIERLRNDGVTADELRKAKNNMLRDEVTAQLTVESKARRLGEAAVLLGDVERVNTRLAEIAALTGEDMQRVARTYLVPEHEIEVRIKPNLLGFIVEKFKDDDDDEPEPAPTGPEKIEGEGQGKPGLKRPDHLGAAPTVAPPLQVSVSVEPRRKVLENGLEVVVFSNAEVPFVTVQLGLEYGAFADPPKRPGTAYITLPMLMRGTDAHPYAELTDELDKHAISLSGSAGMDSAVVRASALAPHAERTIELMAEVVRTPTFPADELDKLVDQTTTGLAVTQRTPEYLADRELRRRVFAGHPYARLPEGDAAALRKVQRADVQNWWKTYARPDTSVLYVAGDVEPDAVFQWAQTHFGPWTATDKAPEIAIPKVAQLPETKIYLVDRKADQSQIRVGHAGIRRDDAHYETARILSEVFGGGFNSRLNDTIRVKKGLTYGARGGFEADRFAGRFTVGTFSKNATVGETVVTILEEIERIQTEAPSTAERSDAISYVVGSFPRRRETPQALVEETWTLHLEELPADYYDRYLARVRAVSSEAAVATAKDLIDPRHLVIVVVGPAKQLAPQLEQIAPVEIVPAFDNAQAKPASGSSSSSKK